MIGRTAAMTAAALLLTATAATAQWRDGARGGWEGMRRFEAAQDYGGRGGPGGYGGRGGRGGFGGRGPSGYGRGGYGQGGDGRAGYEQGGGSGQGGYGRPTGGYGGGGPRRGQVLPPAYRGAYVPDPGRYHLRAPPPGYGWVGDGRNAYLTQRSTGMVLDSVPGAYEPAPAFRGGRGRRPR